MKTFIVKVQRSLFTTKAEQEVLIYNRDRSIEWQGLLTPETDALFPECVDKIYCRARLIGTLIELRQVVKDKAW